MTKFLRYLISIIITLIILIIAGVVILINVINPNDFKDKISALVQQQTGRNLIIKGNIHWSLLPWLAVKVNDVTLGNAPNFRNKTFAKVGEADVRLQLFPLLHGKIRAGKLILKNVDLYLAKNQTGQTNWQDLLKKPTKTATTHSSQAVTATPARVDSKTKKVQTTLVTISGVDIDNANIYWHDWQNNQQAALTKLDLTTSSIALDKPIHIKTKFHFNANQQYNGSLELATKATITSREQRYQLDNLNISGKIAGDKLQPTTFSLKTSAQVINNNLTAKNIKLTINSMHVDGAIDGKNLNNKPIFNGNIAIVTFDASKLLQQFGVKFKHSKTLTKVNVKLGFSANENMVSAKNILINFDKSQLRGSVKHINFSNKTFNFNIWINRLNTDDFMVQPKPKNGAKTKPVVAPKPAAHTVAQPQAAQTSSYVAPKWQGIGTIKITKLIANKTQLSNFQATLSMGKGVVNLTNIGANLYQGSLNGSASYNMQQATPSFHSVTNLNNIQLQPLLQDHANTKKISGVATISSKLSGHGDNADAVIASLNGVGSIKISNGRFHGVDLGYELKRLGRLLKKKPLPTKPQNPVTRFDNVSATFNITNGVVRNNDLLMNGHDYQAAGQGTINLVNQQIDYQVRATKMESVTQNGKQVRQANTIFIPVKITGTLSNPKFRPDFDYALKHIATQVVKQTVKQTIHNVINGNALKKDNIKKVGKSLNKALGIKLF